MRIRNITGSRGSHYRNVGKDEWLKRMGRTTLPTCQIFGCSKPAADVCHVRTDRAANTWYLLPECHEHNENEHDWLDTKATAGDNLVRLTDV